MQVVGHQFHVQGKRHYAANINQEYTIVLENMKIIAENGCKQNPEVLASWSLFVKRGGGMRFSLQFVVFIAIIIVVVYGIESAFGLQTATLYSILISLGVLSVVIIISLENRHPSKTLAWILFLALIPVLGLVFYFIFGRNYRKSKTFDEKAEYDARQYAFVNERLTFYEKELASFSEGERRLIELAGKVANSSISFATSTQVLTNGGETFSALIEQLKQAEHHIHMEYYIYRHDDIGTQIKNILIEKVKQGVEVRFMYDAVGSLKLASGFLQEMREAGIKVSAFNPVTFPMLSNKMNYRNHRKIVVVDGEVGFVGGLNVGDEYLGKNPSFGFWRDTHLLLKGEAVMALQAVFLRDWRYITGEQLEHDIYFKEPMHLDISDRGAVQIVASGPDQEWKSVKSLFFSMITMARRSLWIATPYFIPDEDILTALTVSALSGVDVKILFPKHPDKWLPYYASHSYFPRLLEAGVEIYEYHKGFMHSKVIIADGELASIGTVNMDVRSFNLNFEVSAFLYGTEKVKKLVTNFTDDLNDADRIKLEQEQKGILKRLLESTARLLSPLL